MSQRALSMGQFPWAEAQASVDHVEENGLSQYMPVIGAATPRGFDAKRTPATRTFREHDEVTQVPVNSLRATQAHVYPENVERLAGIPNEAWNGASQRHLPTVARMRDGSHVVYDGHHRVAAARVRGDVTMAVHVLRVETR